MRRGKWTGRKGEGGKTKSRKGEEEKGKGGTVERKGDHPLTFIVIHKTWRLWRPVM